MDSPWGVPRDAVFRWREWDGDVVVYHVNSGDTHFLNALGARALERLQRGPMTLVALADELARGEGCPPTPDFRAGVERLLARFHELGLVEPFDDAGSTEPA
jgi:PqqD family protein of HPr-rel-A system